VQWFGALLVLTPVARRVYLEQKQPEISPESAGINGAKHSYASAEGNPCADAGIGGFFSGVAGFFSSQSAGAGLGAEAGDREGDARAAGSAGSARGARGMHRNVYADLDADGTGTVDERSRRLHGEV
jgi:hypothetical protein